MSSALTSSTMAMATWATTMTLREFRCSRLPLAVRLPRESALPAREYLTAGIAPNSRPESSESRSVNPSERPSSAISFRRGRLAGPIAASNCKPA
jgi:hypothetical protein